MKRFHTLGLATAALLTLSVGCQSGKSEQVVSGTVALSSFPSAVTTVRVVDSAGTVAQAPVAADGSFSISIPRGTGYRLAFADGPTAPSLVFPRSQGRIDSRFDIASAGAPFNLGAVRYIGDATSTGFVYGPTPSESGDTDDIECEDGIDANTGLVCVDDDDDEGASCESGAEDGDDIECENGTDANTGLACDDTDNGEAEDPADTDDIECEDGVDATTGLACDDTDDGAEEAEEDDDGAAGNAAVADHNLPSAVGCAEEAGEGGEDGGIDCEDGTDTATGLPCE